MPGSFRCEQLAFVMGQREEEMQEFACTACGEQVEADTRPDECPECEGGMQNV